MNKKQILRIALIFVIVAIFGVAAFVVATKLREDKPEEVATEEKEEPGTVHLLAGFEHTRELYSLKPTDASVVATMNIYGEDKTYVKEGNSSLKYEYFNGGYPGVQLYVEESSYPQLDISNLNKMNLSVYSQAEKPLEAVLAMTLSNGKILLEERVSLEPNQWNDLEFRLSAIACKYNADRVVGFSLRVETDEVTSFYVDNWSVTMGAENTEEDNKYEPIVKDIIERINALPERITASDGDTLEKIYLDYMSLPELYRNIIPNIDILEKAIESYVDVKYASEEDSLDRKFLAFDEFYGIGMIKNANGSNYPIIYQKDVHYKDEKGSIKVDFDGSTTVVYLAYRSPLKAANYDYIELSFYNDDDLAKTISFDYKYAFKLWPRTWQTVRIPGEDFRAEGQIIIMRTENGNYQKSSGTLYIGAGNAHRSDMAETINNLPKASSIQMPRDIKYVSQIELAKKLYEAASEKEKATISSALVSNMEKCCEKIEGYSTAFNVNTEFIRMGNNDLAPMGEGTRDTDKQYGPYYKMNIQKKAEGDNSEKWSASFMLTKNMSKSKNLFLYIYNPKSSVRTLTLYADGSWTKLADAVLQPGWNLIEIPKDKKINSFLFGLFSAKEDVLGEWKITSVYEKSDQALLNSLIDDLPDAGSVSDGFKYTSIVDEAKKTYDTLKASGAGTLSSARKSKLDAWIRKLSGYTVVFNTRLDEFQIGQYGAGCKGSVVKATDEQYGSVYEINVTEPKGKEGVILFTAKPGVTKDVKNVFLYIYNPTKTIATMNINTMTTAGKNWTNLVERTKVYPGWNLLEFKQKDIQDLIEGVFCGDSEYDITGTWKVSSFVARTEAVMSQEKMNALSKLIDALPSPDAISMPKDLKHLAAIYEAKDLYDAMPENLKGTLSADRKQKLDECIKKANGYGIAINAKSELAAMQIGQYGNGCKGELTQGTDGEYGPVFKLNVTGPKAKDGIMLFTAKPASADTAKNVFFYLYNPTGKSAVMNINTMTTTGKNWKNLVARKEIYSGWNLIELPADAKLEQLVEAVFCGDKEYDVTGDWLVTSFYEYSDEAMNRKQTEALENMIDALPAADSITMPDDLKYVAAIREAEKTYAAFSEDLKALVTAERKQKLNACIEKIAGYGVVINAKTDIAFMQVGQYGNGCKGELTLGTDAAYGPVFKLDVTGPKAKEGVSLLTAKTTLVPNAQNVFFYLYNPTGKSATMNFNTMTTTGKNWKNLVLRKEIVPGWNLIELPADAKLEPLVEGVFCGDTEYDVTGTWKVTSFYEKADMRRIQEVQSLIEALPSEDELTGEHVSVIENAKRKYDSLSEFEKSYLSVADSDKLQRCIEKLPELKASSVALSIEALPNADEIHMPEDIKYIVKIHDVESTFNALSDEDKAKISDELKTKLMQCLEKIEAYSIVSDALTNNMTLDNRYGKVAGTVTKDTDDGYGPVVKFNITTEKAAAGKLSFFTVNDQAINCDNVFFYIYNPTNAAVNAYVRAGSWSPHFGMRTLKPGWNLVQLDNAKKSNYVFADFFEGATIQGEWMVTSFYAGVSEENEVPAMVDALPLADVITLKNVGKYWSAIRAADAAYGELSDAQKAALTVAQKEKLASCVAKIEKITTVLSASTNNMTLDNRYGKVAGTVTKGTDAEYGPVVKLNITAEKAVAGKLSFFTVNDQAINCDNVFFYIYNPTNAAVNAYVRAGSWSPHFGTKTLQPGWNLVQLDNAKKSEYVFADFYEGSTIQGEWMVTSFYAGTLEKSVITTMIDALPSADEITLKNVGKYWSAIRAADAAYGELSDAQKAALTVAQKEKLASCVAKISGVTMILDASTNNMALDNRNGKVVGTVSKGTDEEYGSVVKLDIITEKGNCSLFTVNDSALNCDNVFFYIYNPGPAVSVNIYGATTGWTYHHSWKTLEPGWNLIQLKNDAKSEYVFASFPNASHTIKGEWLVTSFYSGNLDTASVNEVVQLSNMRSAVSSSIYLNPYLGLATFDASKLKK